MNVKQILNALRRKYRYQEVVSPDKDGNLTYIFLQYNPLRKKFYTQRELGSVHRTTISRREAELLVARTLYALKISDK